jgi:hypothetical protein
LKIDDASMASEGKKQKDANIDHPANNKNKIPM